MAGESVGRHDGRGAEPPRGAPPAKDDDGARSFAGEGELAARCRAFDWAATPLGPLGAWPATLRAAAGLVLASPVAMSLWCGPTYTLLYNDAYRGVLGAKHPGALGRSGAAVFAELWTELEPQFESVRAGGPAVSFDDVPFTLERLGDGAPDAGQFSYALSAVRDDAGAVVAVLSVVTETTARARVEAALRAEQERLRSVILSAPAPVALHVGPEHRYALVNDAYRRISGGGRDVTGLTVRAAFPELEGQGIFEAIDRVYAVGEPFVAPETPVRYDRDGSGLQDTWFNLRLEPVRDADGRVTAVLNFSFDVTDQVRARRELERGLGASEESRAALEAAYAQLQEQGLELELTNQQLQDNAAELEMQAEELQATAAVLEERTEEAERARAEVEDVLETMADAHFVLDAEFRFVSANAAMERNVGQTRAQLVGRSLFELFPGTMNTIFERSYRRAMTERVDVHFVGEYADAELDLVPEVDVYPAAGGGIAVFWRDIAPRRRVEAALEKSERQFRTLADAMPTLAWTARADGYIEWYNARWYEYTGTTPADMEGWGWQAVHDPAALPAVLAGWTAAIASGEPFDMTFPLRGADGTFRRFLTRVVPVRDAEGRVVQWFGTNTDIEAERAARADAEAAEGRLRDVFEQAPVAVAVLTGPDLVYTVVSPRYAVSPGAGRTLLNRSVREVFPEDEYAALIATMAHVYATGEPYAVSERKVLLDPRGDGALEPHYYNVGYQPLRDAAGRVYAIASITHDVTEHVLARHEVEVAREVAERERAAAEEANRAKTLFLTTMSHELRTPLNASLGFTELLSMELRGPVTEAQRQDLERIRRANQHLLSLINDVLNFARLEAGRLEFEITAVSLDAVVADLEPLVAPQLAAKGLAFDHDGCSTDTPGRPHVVCADPERLRQVLLNLITNAIKFTDAGGRVSLACETESDTNAVAGVVRVCVSDTGRGIPAADRQRIFEPFVQIDRHGTHASQQGVGLGLAISRELARGMGGDLTVESTVGVGSAFTLTLPRA